MFSNLFCKKWLVFIFIAFVLVSCKSSTSTNISPAEVTTETKVTGFVEKGPFLTKSKCTIQALDKEGKKTENSTETQVLNNKGEFETTFTHNLYYDILKISCTGLYFDEITSKTSTTPATLETITSLELVRQQANVNIATNILSKLIVENMNKNESFKEASEKAETQLNTLASNLGIPLAAGQSFLSQDKLKDNPVLIKLTAAILKSVSPTLSLNQIQQQLVDSVTQTNPTSTIIATVKANVPTDTETAPIQQALQDYAKN